ncbi:hypothetical protein J6N69_03310 [bacterium]|nr:hypothetical protein [bacterium]MBP3847304.1 hypothetical protein [bacterium]
MSTFFIILIITAEIIITCQVASFILKIDKKVCDLNNKIAQVTPKIKSDIITVRIGLNKILLSLNKFEQKLHSKKEEFKFIILKNIVTMALYLILNTNGKKVLSVVELAFDIKDFLGKYAKTFA